MFYVSHKVGNTLVELAMQSDSSPLYQGKQLVVVLIPGQNQLIRIFEITFVALLITLTTAFLLTSAYDWER
jgi:hypothetical protein